MWIVVRSPVPVGLDLVVLIAVPNLVSVHRMSIRIIAATGPVAVVEGCRGIGSVNAVGPVRPSPIMFLAIR